MAGRFKPAANWLTRSPAIWLVVLVLAACGRIPEEEQVRQAVTGMAARLEKRDLAGVLDSVAPSYLDFEGRDRQGLRLLIEEYIRRYRGIVIHVLATRVELSGPEGSAVVEGDAVLSSGAAEVLRKAFRFLGEYYRFRLEMDKDSGSWMVRYAEWREQAAADLFPESLPVLRKLFPGG
jgi:hypothetical protein